MLSRRVDIGEEMDRVRREVMERRRERESFKEAYPRAYLLHELINRPHNVKRFIIGHVQLMPAGLYLI